MRCFKLDNAQFFSSILSHYEVINTSTLSIALTTKATSKTTTTA